MERDTEYDVLIIGGVTGCAIALQLGLTSLKTAVLERGGMCPAVCPDGDTAADRGCDPGGCGRNRGGCVSDPHGEGYLTGSLRT